jgi:cell division protein FtsZ
MAINSPLLDDISIDGAMGILLNFTAGPDVKLKEINEAASLVQQAAHEDANIIFGLLTDPDMGDVVKVTAIATGFDLERTQMAEVVSTSSPRSQRTTTLPLSIMHNQPAARTSAAPRSSMAPARPEPVQHARIEVRAESRESRPSHAGNGTAGTTRRSLPPEERAMAIAGPSGRAFGAAALGDEVTLDIPAYLRRAAAAQHE